jgi:hypothetical protein
MISQHPRIIELEKQLLQAKQNTEQESKTNLKERNRITA